MSNKTADAVNPVLTYLTDTYASDPAGAFSFPRQNAFLKNRAEDFIAMFSKCKPEEIGKITIDKVTFSYLDKDFLFGETVKSEEILDALRHIATRISDRHYRFLKKYFETFTFLGPKSSTPGIPVILKRCRGGFPKDEQVLRKDILGSVGDTEHPLPELEEFGIGKKIPEDINKAIMKFERDKGFRYNTSKLREAIGLHYLAQYQIKTIYNLSAYNYIAACRRSGKSFLASYLAIRHIFKDNKTVLYGMPNETYFFQPMMYFERLISGIAKVDRGISLSMSDNVVRNKETGSVIKLVSAKMLQGIRSFDADAVIIDEADFFPEKEFINLITIIEQKLDFDPTSFFLAMSTIDPEKIEKGESSWFYRELINAELNPSKETFSLRIPITENEFYSERAKEALIAKYVAKNDEIGMRCELFAEYPPSSTQLSTDFFPLALKPVPPGAPISDQIKGVLGNSYHKGEGPTSPSHAFFSYDPAGNTGGSISALTPAILHGEAGGKRKLTLLSPIPIPKSSLFSQQQLPVIMQNMEMLHKNYPNTNIMFVFDIAGIGLPLAELIHKSAKELRLKCPGLHLQVYPVRYITAKATVEKQRVFMEDSEVKSTKDYLLKLLQKMSQQSVINSIHHPILEKAVSKESLDNLAKLNDFLSTIFQIVAVAQYVEPLQITKEKPRFGNEDIALLRQVFAPWQKNPYDQTTRRKARMARFTY